MLYVYMYMYMYIYIYIHTYMRVPTPSVAEGQQTTISSPQILKRLIYIYI